MKNKKIILALLLLSLISAGYALYAIGLHQGMTIPAAISKSAIDHQPLASDINNQSTGKKVLYWHDPMVPGQRFDKPGKSPFMDMQLVPVYADNNADEGNVSISPRLQQNLGIRTADVIKGSLSSTVEVVGNVEYNEREMAVVQERNNGFIEHLYVRAQFDPVKKGQVLAQLYVPEWVASQEEYLSIKGMGNVVGTSGLLDAAVQRMRLVGMTDEQIHLITATGKVQPRLNITSPLSGVVTELGAREGMTVATGASLFRINGTSTLWLNAEVPENLVAQLQPGNSVQAHTPALPGIIFKGKISTVLPEVSATTRTLKARIELSNSGNQLVPGMFLTVNLLPAVRNDILLVPSEAVIQTGQHNIVMVASGDGKFTSVTVEIGSEANGQTEIRSGLRVGQKVVVSGQFLIDSEASIKGVVTRMSDMPTPNGNPAALQVHHGQGKVESINKEEITLSHGPIPTLQWGPMTMGFKLPNNGLPNNLSVGDTVMFDIVQTKGGEYQVTAIVPTNDSSSRNRANMGVMK